MLSVAALTFLLLLLLLLRRYCIAAGACSNPQERHPDVQAVASGAIASDYQRLRVESVSVFSTRRTTCLGDSS
jgi:hypothetical protein